MDVLIRCVDKLIRCVDKLIRCVDVLIGHVRVVSMSVSASDGVTMRGEKTGYVMIWC